MTVRVILVSPARSEDSRDAVFGGGGSLTGDPAALRAAAASSPGLRTGDRNWCSPTPRCRETAAALGVRVADAGALADWRTGRWEGRALDEVAAMEPEAVAAWLADPAAAPHGGETLLRLVERVGEWLDGVSARTTVVAEPAVVRAAMVHALGLPPAVFWRLDVPPLTATELSGRAGRWNLRCGRPLVP